MIRYLPQMPTLGENQLVDPGAEQNTGSVNAQWWGQYFACSRTRENTDKHSGAWSMKYVRGYDATNASGQGAICGVWTRGTGWRGKYKVSGWFKVAVGVQAQLAVRLYKTNGVYFANGTYLLIPATGAWAYCETAPYVLTEPSIVTMQAIILGNQASGLELWIDDIKIERVSTS